MTKELDELVAEIAKVSESLESVRNEEKDISELTTRLEQLLNRYMEIRRSPKA